MSRDRRNTQARHGDEVARTDDAVGQPMRAQVDDSEHDAHDGEGDERDGDGPERKHCRELYVHDDTA